MEGGVSEWVSEWVSERASEWVSKWVSSEKGLTSPINTLQVNSEAGLSSESPALANQNNQQTKWLKK